MEWTFDQTRAIRARGNNLLLSAAAGSGKTAVLVERVLSLIGEGAQIDRMLIVTFSRAAAANMKSRLTGEMAARARDNPRMAEQMERVERASVCTLHAYCIQVLRGHFEAAGVDPAFRVLDDAENRQLEARAMRELLEEALTLRDQDMEALCCGRDVGQISELVLSLYHFAGARPDPGEWLDRALIGGREGDGAPWTQALTRFARARIEEAEALTRYAIRLAEKGPAVYLPALEEDLEALAAMREMPCASLREAAAIYRQAKIKALRTKEDDPDLETILALADKVKALRKEQKSRVDKAAQALPDPETAMEDERGLLPAARALRRLTGRFGEILWALKQDRSALTFEDLEHAALRALGDERVAQAQRSRFDYVFVDEYQDVSDLQEAVLGRVAAGDNLFMVGDVKQSIYRFRQAEPTLFIEKYRRYGAGEGGELISLSQNFRSRPAVLRAVNLVFERAMSGEGAELTYDEAARLNPGTSFPDPDPQPEVRLLSGAQAGEEGDEAEYTVSQAEGALVAREIGALLGTPFYDAKEKKTRPLRPADIAVLSRTRAGIAACEIMLRSAGIPCYMDASEGYFDALEVRVMLSLMQTIENRRRDFALLAVLRSPIVGLTSTQLAQIRAAHTQGAFYEAVAAQMEKRGQTAERLREFAARLTRWRMLSQALPLGEWIDMLLRESGYYAYVGGMAGGAARQGNLDLLCAYASQFESAQSGGLTEFLDYVREVGRAGGDMGAAHSLSEGDDVVRLMTVHKSKGLEFPVVFAVQLGRNLARRPGEAELRCHRDLGAGLFFQDPDLGVRRDTLSRRAVRCAQDDEALEEEKRILYVMMTRAMQRLILVGSERNPEAAKLRWQVMREAPMRPGSFLDMLMPALEGEAQIRWREAEEEAGERPAAQARESEGPDPEMVLRMREALTWRYPYEGEALAPLKLTASGLTREVVGPVAAPPVARRPRFLTRQQMTATERGTLIHAALSALNLDALREGPLEEGLTEQVARMCERNLLSAPVDARLLRDFFTREVGKRLLAAGTVRREWPFNLRMPAKEALGVNSDAPVVVQGVVDCCFLEDGQWVLLDYKTDRLGDDEELMRRYRQQLALYREALLRITGTPVKAVYLCLLSARREIEM